MMWNHKGVWFPHFAFSELDLRSVEAGGQRSEVQLPTQSSFCSSLRSRPGSSDDSASILRRFWWKERERHTVWILKKKSERIFKKKKSSIEKDKEPVHVDQPLLCLQFSHVEEKNTLVPFSINLTLNMWYTTRHHFHINTVSSQDWRHLKITVHSLYNERLSFYLCLTDMTGGFKEALKECNSRAKHTTFAFFAMLATTLKRWQSWLISHLVQTEMISPTIGW